MPAGVPHGSVSKDGFVNICVCGDFGKFFPLDQPTVLSDNAAKEGNILSRMIYDNRSGSAAYLNALCEAFAAFILHGITLPANPRSRRSCRFPPAHYLP